ncbi:MAG: 2Fe-2S iron-sulfur cluster binding domain-containing protein [Magnetococcales bacterium]|nr:2Fe-2S iron-sulfur cluster binding domain-containing protein [Magnetococcales bacterium]MBF0148838.1 2Fe-2S iron-sulfur cluster binding domain-containing protein [Magnetococcales bacterium]
MFKDRPMSLVELSDPSQLFWLSGFVFVVVVAIQGVLSLVALFGRQRLQSRLAREQLQLLKNQVTQTAALYQTQIDMKRSIWSGLRKFRIVKKQSEARDVVSFHLKPEDGGALPGYYPGQFLTFQVWPHKGGKSVTRCYSLSSSPRETDHYRVTIKRIGAGVDGKPGLVSNYFIDSLNEGDTVDVRSPAGHFFLDESRPGPVVLIGGGVGITPVFSMLSVLATASVPRDTWFFHGVKNGDQHLWKESLTNLAAAREHIRLHVCYSQPNPDDREGIDYHHRGHVDIDLLKQLLPSNNFDFFICGPAAMMNSLVTNLLQWGVPEGRIHVETFNPASTRRAEGSSASKRKVRFLRSGKGGTWPDDGQTLLSIAESLKIPMDSGCQVGHCGACKTVLKQGEVTYQTEPSNPPEPGTVLACIALPKTDLEVDA